MADYFIGLMSGTSADGVDGVLADFSGPQLRLIDTCHLPYTQAVRADILALAHAPDLPARMLARLDGGLGRIYADVVDRLLQSAGIAAAEIQAVGSHGQTVRHLPDLDPPYTLQLGDPNIIAEATGITVVADFRRRDMAAGGQGAPLVPAFHAARFRRNDRERAVVNIGGMANITLLPADPMQPVTGFDTGPGNVLLDGWHARHLDGPFDPEGGWAASGRVDTKLLARLLADPYFDRPPPKSTGREQFSLEWLQRGLDNERPEDVQATLAALTVESIAAAIEGHAPETAEVIVCGGGVRNLHLMGALQRRLPALRVSSSEAYGLAPEWVEATAFAWLARRTLASEAGNLPAVTGARHPVILGAIYPGDMERAQRSWMGV